MGRKRRKVTAKILRRKSNERIFASQKLLPLQKTYNMVQYAHHCALCAERFAAVSKQGIPNNRDIHRHWHRIAKHPDCNSERDSVIFEDWRVNVKARGLKQCVAALPQRAKTPTCARTAPERGPRRVPYQRKKPIRSPLRIESHLLQWHDCDGEEEDCSACDRILRDADVFERFQTLRCLRERQR